MDEYDFMSREEWNEETAEEIESEEQTIEERIDGWRELNDLRLNHETKTTLLQQWKASAAAAVKKRPRLNLEGKTLRKVKEAVERIKIGDNFVSFDDFEFGLDCWCALHLRSSHKFKMLPTCKVRVCRYGRPLLKVGGEMVTEWPSVTPRPSAAVGPSAVGVRSFQDFRQGRRTPSQPIRNLERPDLNLLNQEFTPVPTNRKKKRCGRGECGERSRYNVASMVAANRVGAWEAEAQAEEGEIRESEEKNKCAWRVLSMVGEVLWVERHGSLLYLAIE
ncbi:hypothetical protein R1sor_022598 [Riccia sorocarpa]|uniref:Uncharacterized protein n=1 Tax=Riccia sorocarpa TaxID=122646 RepID=A0ABD3GNB0_9MARC